MSEKNLSHEPVIKCSRRSICIIFLFAACALLVLFRHYYIQEQWNVLPPFSKPIIFTLSEKPQMRLYKNFISKDEANHLIAISKNLLKPSTIVVDGKNIVDDQWRTSYTARIDKSQDKIVRRIEERVSRLIGCSIDNMEPLQVVHYTQGQEYKPHLDYFSPSALAVHKSQREHTVLLYLNDLKEEDGGKTIFPALKIEVQAQRGTALYFSNMDEYHRVDGRTLHGGAPVKANVEKWACNIWIRDKPFSSEQPKSADKSAKY